MDECGKYYEVVSGVPYPYESDGKTFPSRSSYWGGLAFQMGPGDSVKVFTVKERNHFTRVMCAIYGRHRVTSLQEEDGYRVWRVA